MVLSAASFLSFTVVISVELKSLPRIPQGSGVFGVAMSLQFHALICSNRPRFAPIFCVFVRESALQDRRRDLQRLQRTIEYLVRTAVLSLVRVPWQCCILCSRGEFRLHMSMNTCEVRMASVSANAETLTLLSVLRPDAIGEHCAHRREQCYPAVSDLPGRYRSPGHHTVRSPVLQRCALVGGAV